ncbi:class I SAM-dependent methyltransferase [Roseovarius atlanticus]|uniref:class I SAM-dependent methyltransferase n=1 Tax=Roseovarius atlanticus TaxID=1641875 RepID=UPI001C95362A|nr:class I SAM-dependent methyltransferase [Roseovarius atlanticus]MBY5989352.1 class I SAM-dependent methyltransferase [Roseovarius atlanticus]MBY6124744.1 class I SAM-dependent methyltransferase [Roseovarius atlanticus]MBY6149239.1 class I SAM-dependent methyltransferase [Roseovarius atlanticus]
MDGLNDAPDTGAAGDPGTVEVTLRQRANRRQARYGMLFDCFRHVITDSSVLYLGAGDGRWCADLAQAGALQVVGVEAQDELIARFDGLPSIGARERVEMRRAAPLDFLQTAADMDKRFDLVVLMDVLRDVSDLHEVFEDIARLRPRMVMGDGVLATSAEPLLRLEPRRAAGATARAPHMIPSRGAITQAATANGFEVDWTDWTQLPPSLREGLSDYYRSGPIARASFTLIDAGT